MKKEKEINGEIQEKSPNLKNGSPDSGPNYNSKETASEENSELEQEWLWGKKKKLPLISPNLKKWLNFSKPVGWPSCFLYKQRRFTMSIVGRIWLLRRGQELERHSPWLSLWLRNFLETCKTGRAAWPSGTGSCTHKGVGKSSKQRLQWHHKKAGSGLFLWWNSLWRTNWTHEEWDRYSDWDTRSYQRPPAEWQARSQ